MRHFTNEELKALEQYEPRFKSAMELNYVRNLEPRYLITIKAIYDSATGVAYGLNSTCSHCVLAFMAAVGKKYFADKKLIEAEAQKLIEATNSLGDSASRAAQLVKALDEVMADVPTDEPVSKELEPKPAKKPAPKKSNKKATKK